MQRVGGVPTSLVELGADNDECGVRSVRGYSRDAKMKYNGLKMKIENEHHYMSEKTS